MWKYTREGHGVSVEESSRNASTASLVKVSYPSLAHGMEDIQLLITPVGEDSTA